MPAHGPQTRLQARVGVLVASMPSIASEHKNLVVRRLTILECSILGPMDYRQRQRSQLVQVSGLQKLMQETWTLEILWSEFVRVSD